MKTIFFILFAAAAVSVHAADPQTPFFSDDFENRTEPGKDYKIALAGPDSWTIRDGVLIGRQSNPEHGAVIRKELAFDNIDIEIDFRFNGGTRFNFVIDDVNEKSVHAGHICRVSISPKSLKVSDDKTGGMNLEVRAQRQQKNLPSDQKKALDALLSTTESSAKLSLEPGTWYHLRVRIDGDLMEAYIDGTLIASLNSPGLAHLTKTKFGMTVKDATIDFDNLKVFEVTK
jgi:hypothetical protein